MVDNVTMRVNRSLPKPNVRLLLFLEPKLGKERTIYKLSTVDNAHQLIITDYGNYFSISGSIRKFHLGKYTYEDIKPQDLPVIAKNLAKLLMVKPSDIAKAIITKLEFGKTFTLWGSSCRSIQSKISSYSKFQPIVEDSTVTFKGQDFKLTLYDKAKEIVADNPKLKKDFLETNKLRIELKMKDRKGVIEKGRGIVNFSDLANNYRMLVVTFLREIKRLKFKTEDGKYDSISFKKKNIKDLKRYLIYKGILNVGISQTLHFLKEIECSIQGKSLYKGQFLKLLSELEHLSQYGRKEFLKDIRRELAQEISNPELNNELL